MGVYVKDATAPKNCTGCIAVHYYVSIAGDAGMLCEVTGLSMDDYYSDGRPDWCPLIEVPEPHGRLIDADELDIYQRAEAAHAEYQEDEDNLYLEGMANGLCEAAKQLSTARTVIHASKEG